MNLLVSAVSIPVWIAILTVPVIVLTIYGYDWIHRWQRWMTALLGVTFVVIFIQALLHGAPPGALSPGPAAGLRAVHGRRRAVRHLDGELGAVCLGLLAVPAAADVSRPHVLGGRSSAAPSRRCSARVLGAYLAVLLPTRLDGGRRPGRGGQLGAADDGGQPDRLRRGQRLHRDAGPGRDRQLLPGGARARYAPASPGRRARSPPAPLSRCSATSSSSTNLSTSSTSCCSCSSPGSAINLTDYYLVRHGDYDVASFFTPRGRYGGCRGAGFRLLGRDRRRGAVHRPDASTPALSSGRSAASTSPGSSAGLRASPATFLRSGYGPIPVERGPAPARGR